MTSLSKSELWTRMQEYYNNIGPGAWENEVVPLQISSNKTLANGYANLIISHINDYLATNPDNDNSEPFYIIEVGSGHGKFSHYLIKTLNNLLSTYNLNPNTCKYIMTDIAEKNIESWESHPALNQWKDKSILDFALYNAMEDTSIHLKHTNLTITAGSLSKPVFVVCNYLFDSLAHDAFQVRDHQLFEAKIDLSSAGTWEKYLESAEMKFSYDPVSTDYYDDPDLNNILKHYQQELDNSSFLIPISGIQCIKNIQKFTNQHVMLLIADKGQSEIELFDELSDPDIDKHGAISLMVNFDGLRRYFEAKQGTGLLMPNKSSNFQVACFTTINLANMPHTRHAFQQSFSGATPQDLISLCYHDDEFRADFHDLDEMLAILNLNLWDPSIFYDIHEDLLCQIEDNEIDVEQERCLIDGAKLVADFYYKLEKSQDLPFAIAGLYYTLDCYNDAIPFYMQSIKEFGKNPDNCYNLALCYQEADKLDLAKQYAKYALQCDADYSPARELINELEQELDLVSSPNT